MLRAAPLRELLTQVQRVVPTATADGSRWLGAAHSDRAAPLPRGSPGAAGCVDLPRAAPSRPPLARSTPPPPLNFDDARVAFQDKSTGEIVRSLLVFRACQSPWLVDNADTVLKRSKMVFGSTLVNWVVRNTFYKQFVAGADAEGIKPTLERLRRCGVHAVLDYAAEDDVKSDDGPRSRAPPTASVVARTYSYEDEAACDRRTASFMKAIDAVRPDSRGFAAVKVTALGMPRLLERTSAALLAIRGLFGQLDTNGDGWLDPGEFRQQYERLFTDGAGERVDQVFSYLDRSRTGRVDYLTFTDRVSVRDGAAIAARFREQGPFSRAALTDEELRLLDRLLGRVQALARAAADAGVRLMVDAEHSYFQPAIDSLVAQLQREHNQRGAVIFGTYQCYLRGAQERLRLDLERARREGYHLGAKLVRGAYLTLERQHAAQAGRPSPTWASREETHAAYDGAVASLLPVVRDGGAEMMVATHNQASVERAVEGMAALGLPPSSPVYFGQLLGMADHLTFSLGRNGYGAYKYVPFAGVDEVMPYLIRRAQENSAVLSGVGREAALLRAELRRRLLRW